MSKKTKSVIGYLILLLGVPAAVLVGHFFFPEKQYAFTTLIVSVISIIPFVLQFENNETDLEKLIIVAVMTALSSVGRIAFEALPHFKPVTAVVIIKGMYLGKEAGFMCGAFSALISNFSIGQGPWTPFQMFSWGTIGLLAAVLADYIKKNIVLTVLFGGAAGFLYSLLMDVFTTLWEDGYFNFTRYFAKAASSLPVTAVYTVSNIVFLLIISKPFGKVIERIKLKYGIN